MLIAFAKGFTSDAVAFWFPTLLLVVAVVAYVVYCRRPYAQLFEALASVRKLLATCASPQEFTSRFDVLSREFQRISGFGPSWSSLRNALEVEPDGSRVIGSDEVADHLEAETIIRRIVPVRLIATIPNLLTGVGILGTFLGLACGILLAKDGLISHDAAKTTAALQDLFGGASVAFWKSVAGLFASMAFTFFERHRHHAAQQEISAITDTLASFITVVTPTQALLRHLTALDAESRKVSEAQLAVMREQEAQLKNFNNRLVVALKDALEESYAKRMQESFAQVLQRVELLGKELEKTGLSMVGQLGESIRKSMSSTIGGNVDVQLTGIDGLKEALTSLAPTLEASRRELEVNSRRMFEEVSSLMASTRTTAEEHFRSSAGTLEGTIRMLAEKTEQQAGQVQALVTEMQQASARMTAQMEEAAGRARSAHQEKLAELSEHLSTTLRSTSSQLGSEIERAGKSLAQRSEEQAGHLAKVAADLQSVVQQWSASMRESGQFTEGMTRLITRLDESQQAFQAATGALKSAATDLSGSSNKIVAFGDRSTSVVERLGEVQRQIQTATEACAESWKDYRDRFEGIDESLGRTFQQFNSGLVQCAEIVQKFMGAVDQDMSRAISSLEGVVSELSDGMEELPDQVKQVGEQIGRLKDTLEAFRRSLPEGLR